MNKNTYYFSHDYTARNDFKIKKLLQKHGFLGYGIYWALIEDLYMNDNSLQYDIEVLSYEYRCDLNVLGSVINDFNLFLIDNNTFYSESILHRLNLRNEKSEKARFSASKRWNNANAIQTQSESNAIKERKVKESKIKDIINIDNNNIAITISKEIDTNKKNKHSFEKSPIFDKKEFAKAFPEWSKDKLLNYYESALLYSQSKGAKYLNWVSAIKNWDRIKPYNANGKSNHEQRKSELAESIAERERKITTILSNEGN
jgi:hypothetical protein